MGGNTGDFGKLGENHDRMLQWKIRLEDHAVVDLRQLNEAVDGFPWETEHLNLEHPANRNWLLTLRGQLWDNHMSGGLTRVRSQSRFVGLSSKWGSGQMLGMFFGTEIGNK